ncbi:MAG TPA: hypothetical protein VG694_01340 [Candidatus Paceibacterota bacterium]|nr:hypothetical protein [Candidatus Paceibacterota bacterium]
MNRGRTARLWAFSATGMLSLVVLVPAVASLLGDFAKSGFYDYFSLLFSGAGVGSYWKDFVASLADSLPTANIIYTLALSLVFALSIKYALRQAAPEWLTNARHAH